jgi:hypothetical protein
VPIKAKSVCHHNMDESSNVLRLCNMNPMKRRHYSKKGCKECKRRKIKCDEGHPSCWQCQRLRKVCEYPEGRDRVKRGRASPLLAKLAGDTMRGNKSSVSSSSSPRSPPATRATDPVSRGEDAPQMTDSKPIISSIVTLLNDNAGATPRRVGSADLPPDRQPLHHQSTMMATYPPKVSSNLGLSQASGTMYGPPVPSSVKLLHFQPTELPKGDLPNPHFVYPIVPHQNLPATPHTTSFLPPVGNDIPSLPVGEFEGFSKDDLNLLASDLNNIVNNIMFESKYDINAAQHDFDLAHTSSSTTPYNMTPDDLGFSEALHNTNGNGVYKAALITSGSPTPGSGYRSIVSENLYYTMEDPMRTHRPNGNGASPIDSILVGPLSRIGGPLHAASTGIPNVPKSVPLDFIKISKPHEKLYLEEFYNEFAVLISPFGAYDESTSTYMHPARDILLTCALKEAYLLAAILAQGAKSSFKKSGFQEDERAYCSYLSKCLQLLGPALGNYNKVSDDERDLTAKTSVKRGSAVSKSGKIGQDGPATAYHGDDRDYLTANIEAVLLTVLLLTSANASNSKQNWRAHLRGAKDLLLKYFFTNNKSKLQLVRSSPILVFCKYWYVSIEILAGLSSEYGGTLKGEEELDMLLRPGDEFEISVMKAFKIIRTDGFNLLFGYHNDCVSHLRDLIKVLNKLRASSKGESGPATFVSTEMYFKLISLFYIQGLYQSIDRNVYVGQEILKYIETGGSLVETFTDRNGNKISISWVDLLHQAYVMAAEVTILTKGLNLPSSSKAVQDLVTKFVTMLKFLTFPDPPLMKYAILMLLWPVLTIGVFCMKEDERFLVMKLLRLSAQNGSGSAGISLRRLHKKWTKQLCHQNDDESDADSEVDMMTY